MEVLKVLILAMAVLLTSLVFVGDAQDHFRLDKGVAARHQLALSRIVGDERSRAKLNPGQRERNKLKTESQLKKQLFPRQSDQVTFKVYLIWLTSLYLPWFTSSLFD